jgi:hypothetical protein
MLTRMQMRTCETRARASWPEAHDIVQDVSDQKAPPDDEGKDQGQGGRRSGRFVGSLLSPTNPIGWQQRQSDGDEMLFEVKETKRLPMAGVLQIRPDVDAEVHVEGSAEQRGNQIENDDRVGV